MSSPAKQLFETVQSENLIGNSNSPINQLKKLLNSLDKKLDLPEEFSDYIVMNELNQNDLKFLRSLKAWMQYLDRYPFFEKTLRGKLLLKKLTKLIDRSINYVGNNFIETDIVDFNKKCVFDNKKGVIDYQPQGFRNGNKIELKFYQKVIETRLDIEARLSKPKKEQVGKLYKDFLEKINNDDAKLNEEQIKNYVYVYFNN